MKYIFILGVLVFFNSLFNQFVLDDPSQITGNPAVQSIANIPRLFLGSSFGGGKSLEGIYYKPVMTTFYALLYSAFGPTPFFFHSLQVILHIGSAILVFWLFKKFFKPPTGEKVSLILALIFLVHPINAEPVIYISNLQDTLFLFFGLLSLLVATKNKLANHDYAIFILTIFLSMLSKETGLLFLIISIVYRFVFRPSFDKFYLISVLCGVAYLTIRYAAVGIPISAEHIFPIERLSFWDRMRNIPAIIYYYLKTFFYPKDLTMAQMWTIKSISLTEFYLPLSISLMGLIGLISLIFKTSSKTLLFFTIWLLIGVGLHLHFIPLDATVADRWFYFPSIGLLGILGVGLNWFFSKTKLNIMVITVITIIIVIFSFRTIVRNTNFADGLTLARHDAAINQDSFALENNLGFELIQAGLYNEAEIHVQKSVELAPYWWLNWNNLGVIYRHNKNIDKALEAFRQAALNTNSFYLPYQNLSELLLNFKSPAESKQFLDETAKKIGLNDNLFFIQALTFYKLGEIDQAKQAIKKALILNPNNNLYSQLRQALENNQPIQIQPPNY